MSDLRKLASIDLVKGIYDLNKITNYYNIYPQVSDFLYENNRIYDDVYSIDVSSFNTKFLIYINRFIKSDNITKYALKLDSTAKENRVVEFGLFYREVSNADVGLSKYMVSTRNIIFYNFFNILSNSPRSLQLLRINYDDIEFKTLDDDLTVDLFVNKNFLDIVKLNKYDKVIVLNKKDGVYYINDNKISYIKYTSGWVNIPAYRYLINLVISFILDETITMDILNNKIFEYIEYSSNDDFFGYDDDDISKHYNPTDVVPTAVKYLFVANVMSKFSILFK